MISASSFLENLDYFILLEESNQKSDNFDHCFDEYQTKWHEAVVVYKKGEASCDADRLETVSNASVYANTHKLLLDSQWSLIESDLNVCDESEPHEGIICYETRGTHNKRKLETISRDAHYYIADHNQVVEIANNDYRMCETEYSDALVQTEYDLRNDLQNCILGIPTTTSIATIDPITDSTTIEATRTTTTSTSLQTLSTVTTTTPGLNNAEEEPVPEVEDSSELSYYYKISLALI